ncbi:hypothetical protein [Frigoriglobus tundricola]|uniref:hypothetical protein n=1 Tax=Frigoriglobus tundricola TaxID=2774151 RepID=UPI00148EAF5E|nr:hypothetical protein [Frigoriglobus tundricola]
MPRLTALLVEGEQAYQFWQAARTHRARQPGQRETEQARQQAVTQFWAEFCTRFPLVCDYLGALKGAEDWNNGLAGQLGMLVDPIRECQWLPSATLVCIGAQLYLQLNGIWHASEMGRLEAFCEGALGASAAASVSEEDFDRDEENGADFDPFELFDV